MLRDLESRYAISGMEYDVRNYINDKISSFCTTYTDGIGNLHGINHGKGPRILLLTHMDEPGIIITQITDDGYLQFDVVGDIEPAFLVSKRVLIGSCFGVISLKAIHLTKKEEREIPVTLSQLYIDIGALNRKEAEEIVTIGDYGVLDISYTELASQFVKGRALAGRIGCSLVVELLKNNTNRNLHGIFSVQHEIGHRGILTCKNMIDYDYAIIFDKTEGKTHHATTTHGIELGKGVVFSLCNPNESEKAFMRTFQESSKKDDIMVQYKISEYSPIQTLLNRADNHAIFQLSIPVRYSKSVAQVANLNDKKAAADLAQYLIDFLSKEATL